jgi:hypothetical protein
MGLHEAIPTNLPYSNGSPRLLTICVVTYHRPSWCPSELVVEVCGKKCN